MPKPGTTSPFIRSTSWSIPRHACYYSRYLYIRLAVDVEGIVESLKGTLSWLEEYSTACTLDITFHASARLACTCTTWLFESGYNAEKLIGKDRGILKKESGICMRVDKSLIQYTPCFAWSKTLPTLLIVKAGSQPLFGSNSTKGMMNEEDDSEERLLDQATSCFLMHVVRVNASNNWNLLWVRLVRAAFKTPSCKLIK